MEQPETNNNNPNKVFWTCYGGQKKFHTYLATSKDLINYWGTILERKVERKKKRARGGWRCRWEDNKTELDRIQPG